MVVGAVYYPYVFVVWGPSVNGRNCSISCVESLLSLGVLMVFNFLVGMLVWSLIQTLITDPGRVPIYWVDTIK